VEENVIDNQSDASNELEQRGHLRSISSELKHAYPNDYKNLAKVEIKVFDQLNRLMKSETEWIEFVKTFKLYYDGIISYK
jgi:hypothetical protein